MIEITKDQCTRMLVWDDEEYVMEAMVYAKLEGCNYPYKVLFDDGSTGMYKHAKPLPEPKPMSALDVMWWAGIRKVWRIVGGDYFWCVSTFCSDNPVEAREWNELIHKDGETTLLYDEWKEFDFENCKMEE